MTDNKSGPNGDDTPVISRPVIESMRELSESLTSLSKDVDRGMRQIADRIQSNARVIHDAVSSMTKAMQPAIKWFNRYSAAKKPLRQRGILPHRSTPWGLFDDEAPNEFPQQVLDYYTKDWDQAEEIFLADVSGYHISSAGKAAFAEAVQCHRHGLYRSSVIATLTAAEMEFRRAFELGPSKPATSLVELRETIMEAPAGVLLSHIAPIDLFEVLDTHIYAKVASPDTQLRFASDNIPNRHAAVHGLVQYDTSLHSLNGLIIADYVFFLISQLAILHQSAED